MSGWSLYGWGVLGGAVTALMAYVVPGLASNKLNDTRLNVTIPGVLGVIGLVMLLAAIAGVASLIPAHVNDRGHAIGYGLGAQALFKGFVASIKDAIKG
jgi:hypothetical protein